MKQITLRGVDAELAHRLREEARKRGQSLNRTVLAILRQATGIATADEKPKEYHDLDHLAGSMSKEEYEEFTKALEEQRRIEEEMWK